MRQKNLLMFLIIFLTLFLIIGHLFTGIFSSKNIDQRDLQKWNYNSDNKIINTSSIFIEGDTKTCWLLIHSFTSTSHEFDELIPLIKTNFNDTISAPTLYGHGEVPSKILNHSLFTWFDQIEKEFSKLEKNCTHINVLGSSYGGAIATKIAQEKKIKNLYLINVHYRSNFDFLLYLDWPLIYIKKIKQSQINSKEGLNKHIAYFNMPLKPTKKSIPFLTEIDKKLHKINSPLFIAHSKNDKVSYYKKTIKIFNTINSSKKTLKWYNNSNHILLRDYDKLKVMSDIINFEKKNR